MFRQGMDFGDTVRALLAERCGDDFRIARASTLLPDLDATARADLATALERTFAIRLADDDLEHVETVRDVMQCIRLRRWTQRTDTPAPADRPAAVSVAAASAHGRDRLIRRPQTTRETGIPAVVLARSSSRA
jgi:acyl carrier protein